MNVFLLVFRRLPQLVVTWSLLRTLTATAFANVIGVHSDYLLDLFKYFDK